MGVSTACFDEEATTTTDYVEVSPTGFDERAETPTDYVEGPTAPPTAAMTAPPTAMPKAYPTAAPTPLPSAVQLVVKVIKATIAEVKLKSWTLTLGIVGVHTHLQFKPSGKSIDVGPQGGAGHFGHKFIPDTFGVVTTAAVPALVPVSIECSCVFSSSVPVIPCCIVSYAVPCIVSCGVAHSGSVYCYCVVLTILFKCLNACVFGEQLLSLYRLTSSEHDVFLTSVAKRPLFQWSCVLSRGSP